MAQYDSQTYQVCWDEIVTKQATVYASSAAEALDMVREGDYDDIDAIDQDETGDGYTVYDEEGHVVLRANYN